MRMIMEQNSKPFKSLNEKNLKEFIGIVADEWPDEIDKETFINMLEIFLDIVKNQKESDSTENENL